MKRYIETIQEKLDQIILDVFREYQIFSGEDLLEREVDIEQDLYHLADYLWESYGERCDIVLKKHKEIKG